ncbi:hypothetical protein L249_1887 [Ophiocordyceps polyrhachis-furcata BCC 54312]|uniref:1,3-beta-glucanosyltransferase n=1 Tax=Ophiocordyceps polyrhachis-furcata BCC 54312 TaxID=1330021 RepID=A0A367LQW8_9HYPO|nr:hypothetical protein L249_1887 [Ophiocordyceps polyrhachis-furcata BCC 54312]
MLSLSLLALAGSVLADLPSIEMKGAKLFYPNGTQFFMKGVAYQQDIAAAGQSSAKTHYSDPLSDEDRCKRDVKLLKELGTNVIRTYAINPDMDHSGCMRLLQDAGIYVVSDLSEPKMSINRDNPQWDTVIFSRYQKVIDELSRYSNVIGFFAGNEVSNNKTNTQASAYVKAAVRDTKAYIKNKKNSRWMGVGYAANDDRDIRKEIADYFNCGKAEESIDFWGYNIYSWCGQSSMQKSGYDQQIKFFESYSVPVFFAEYGCNIPGGADGRIFQETAALYSNEMTKVFTGGIVFMYFQEENDYGLVKITDGKAVKGKSFETLQKQLTKADPKGVSRDSYSPNNKPQKCPDPKSANWKANSALPPTPDQSLCDCMVKSRSCVQKKGLTPDDYSSMFGFICGAAPEVCTGIRGNASTGVYGAYSMCSDSAKLDFVLDAYYAKQNKDSSACDFDQKAGLQSGSADSSCDAKLARASDINKHAATATAPIGGGATSTDDSSAAPGMPMPRLLAAGDYTMGLYVAAAGKDMAAVFIRIVSPTPAMAPTGNGPESERRPGSVVRAVLGFVKEWVHLNGIDCGCLAAVGVATFAIYHARVPVTRTFPVTFSGSGDVVYPEWAYPYRGWIIPSWASGVVAIGGPILIYGVAQIRIRSAWDASCAIMGSIWAVLLATFFQVVLKQLIGGFRPYFLDVCMPDVDGFADRTGLNGVGFQSVMYTVDVCTQTDGALLKTAITSFPSGHTSATCAGFGFLFLWLNAKLKVWADHQPAFWKLFLTMFPVLLCAVISCSLTIDAAHNWYDIVGGAVIGLAMALAAYRASYAAVWNWRFNHVPLHAKGAFSYSAADPDVAALTLTRTAGWGDEGNWLPRHADDTATGGDATLRTGRNDRS